MSRERTGVLPSRLNLGQKESVMSGTTATQTVMTVLQDQLNREELSTRSLQNFLATWHESESKRRGEGPWLGALAMLEDKVEPDNQHLVDRWMSTVILRVLIDRGVVGEEPPARGGESYVDYFGRKTKKYYGLVAESEELWKKIEQYGAEPKVAMHPAIRVVAPYKPEAINRTAAVLEQTYENMVNSRFFRGLAVTTLVAAQAEATWACAATGVVAAEIQEVESTVEAAKPTNKVTAELKPEKSPLPPTAKATAEPTAKATLEAVQVATASLENVPKNAAEWYKTPAGKNFLKVWKEAWAARGIIYNQPTSPESTEVAPNPTLRDYVIQGVDGASNMTGLEALGEDGPYAGMVLCVPINIATGKFYEKPAMSDAEDPQGATKPLMIDIEGIKKDGLRLVNNGRTYLAIDESGKTVKYLDMRGNWVSGQPTPEAPEKTPTPAATATATERITNFNACLGNASSLAEIVKSGCQSPDPLAEPEKFDKWLKSYMSFIGNSKQTYNQPVFVSSEGSVDMKTVRISDMNSGIFSRFYFVHDGKEWPVITLKMGGVFSHYLIVGSISPGHQDATLKQLSTDGKVIRLLSPLRDKGYTSQLPEDQDKVCDGLWDKNEEFKWGIFLTVAGALK